MNRKRIGKMPGWKSQTQWHTRTFYCTGSQRVYVAKHLRSIQPIKVIFPNVTQTNQQGLNIFSGGCIVVLFLL